MWGYKMLVEKCEKYYDKKYDLNCAETILYAANEEYKLNMGHNTLKLSGGFGGGMGVEGVCGALTGAVMVLGRVFVNKRSHESERVKLLTKELVERFTERLKTRQCDELKKLYRDDNKRCMDIVGAAAEILDDIIKRERGKKIK
jgi:C_GCAxxG_C_C family probable redox protein